MRRGNTHAPGSAQSTLPNGGNARMRVTATPVNTIPEESVTTIPCS